MSASVSSRRTMVRMLGGALLAGLAARPSEAQVPSPDWPSRPIRVIVPFGAGTSADVLTRIVAPHMSETLRQPIVVENRTGAGGVVGSDLVAKAAPDGYTLCMGSIASHSVNASLMPNMPYDILRDFVAISLVTVAPNLLVVEPRVPARTLPEFIAWAKGQRSVTYASSGSGTSSHLAGALLRLRTGAPLEHVPYRSGAQAVTDVVAGHVPMMIYQVTSLLPLIREGRLRALAATSARRLEWTPDVPTAMEQGVPEFDVSAWHGLFAPALLPDAIRDRLFGALRSALDSPALRAQLLEQGLEPVGMPPAAFRPFLQADIAKWAEVVQTSGARPD